MAAVIPQRGHRGTQVRVIEYGVERGEKNGVGVKSENLVVMRQLPKPQLGKHIAEAGALDGGLVKGGWQIERLNGNYGGALGRQGG